MRPQIAALLLLVTVGLAGCAGSDTFAPVSDSVHMVDRELTFPPFMMLDGNGVPIDADALEALGIAGLRLETLPMGVESMVPAEGSEPNLGITRSGAIFVTTMDQIQKSTDKGLTWEVVLDFVTPPHEAVEDYFDTADPMLWVDPVTDRIFANHMHPALFCTYMYWSDDDGETWIDRPWSCGTPRLDHQKIMTSGHGPNAPLAFEVNPVYPSPLYLCVNKLDLGTWCAVSHDGGLNYAYDNMVKPPGTCGALNGHPAPFPDGTVAVAFPLQPSAFCDEPVTVAITEDDGLTWDVRNTCAPDYVNIEVDADITVTPDGTGYLLFRHSDHHQYLARTTDKFATCDVFRISSDALSLTRFTAITSGDDGSIAMSYLGTVDPQDEDATPSNAIGGTRWHAYVTTSFNAADEEPVFITQRVTPDEDPVQVGCAWEGGGDGGPHKCRNMLDFIDMVSDEDGRYYVAITDGCVPRNGCTGDIHSIGYQSRDRQTAVIVQTGGLGLRGTVLPPIDLEHPVPILEAP